MAAKRPLETEVDINLQCATCAKWLPDTTEVLRHIDRSHRGNAATCTDCNRVYMGITQAQHKVIVKETCTKIGGGSSSKVGVPSSSATIGAGSDNQDDASNQQQSYKFDDLFEYHDKRDILGSGAAGKVYACRATSIANPVFGAMGKPPLPTNLCVKIYRGDIFRNSAEATKTLDREYRTLEEAIHPNIVRLVAVFQDYDEMNLLSNVHLVLERALPPPDGPLLSSTTLNDRLKYGGPGELFRYMVGRGKQPEGTCRFIMYQFLAAVHCLHSLPEPIVHRDLKTENALVFGEVHTSAGLVPRIKLTDFGTARHIPPHQLLMQSDILTDGLGSPQYIAPEVLIPSSSSSSSSSTTTTTSTSSSSASSGSRGHGAVTKKYSYTPKVDIYSLGVTLFFMLTFELPYASTNEDKTGAEWRARMVQRDVRWNVVDPHLSAQGRDLLRWMIQSNQDVRFSAEQCLAHEWFDPIRGEVSTVFNDDLLLKLKR